MKHKTFCVIQVENHLAVVISNNIHEEIQELKKFRMSLEKESEEAIIANSSFGKESRLIFSDCYQTNIFVLDVFKDIIKHLETELFKEDAIINHLSNQLSSSKFSNSQNSENIDKVVDESLNSSNNECFSTNTESHDMTKSSDNYEINKKRLFITGDFLLNGIHKKRLSKNQLVKVKSIPGGTSNSILDKIDDLVSTRQDCLLVHTGTNDLNNQINPLNNVKKIDKNVKKILPNTKVVFSSLIVRKDRKGTDKKL